MRTNNDAERFHMKLNIKKWIKWCFKNSKKTLFFLYMFIFQRKKFILFFIVVRKELKKSFIFLWYSEKNKIMF